MRVEVVATLLREGVMTPILPLIQISDVANRLLIRESDVVFQILTSSVRALKVHSTGFSH